MFVVNQMPESRQNIIVPLLIGTCMVILLQLLSVEKLDWSLTVALYAVTVAMPGLVYEMFVDTRRKLTTA